MKKLANVVTILMIICIIAGCNDKKSDEELRKIIGTPEIETEYYKAAYVIDTDNLSSVTTYAKYIFVGEIEQYVKTEYDSEDENEIYTYYSVKVKENIKGELITDSNIEVKKAGGIKKDQKSCLVCKGDILPAEGKTYIFAAVMFEADGSVYCFGPNTVALLESNDDFKEDETYKKYIEAMEVIDNTVPQKEWSMSKFDVSYEK